MCDMDILMDSRVHVAEDTLSSTTIIGYQYEPLVKLAVAQVGMCGSHIPEVTVRYPAEKVKP